MGLGIPIEYNDDPYYGYDPTPSLLERNDKLKARINRDKQRKKEAFEKLKIIYNGLLFASAITTNKKDKTVIEEAIQATKDIYTIFQVKLENNK